MAEHDKCPGLFTYILATDGFTNARHQIAIKVYILDIRSVQLEWGTIVVFLVGQRVHCNNERINYARVKFYMRRSLA